MKPEMWQKVAKFKGAEYFRKALYVELKNNSSYLSRRFKTEKNILIFPAFEHTLVVSQQFEVSCRHTLYVLDGIMVLS